MAKFIILFLISFLHYSVPYPRCYWPDHMRGPWERIRCDRNGDSGQNGDGEGIEHNPVCPEGESLLSSDDIVDMIDYIAARIHLEENIVHDYNTKLKNASHKYLKEIEDFHEILEDRPKHIHHILEEMADKREKIELVVNSVSEKLQDINDQSERLHEVEERSDKLLSKFEMYKKICEINCGNSRHFEKYRSKQYLRSVSRYPSNTACWKIKDLYSKISDELTDFYEETNRELSGIIDNIDDIYNDYLVSYKKAWKKAAIERFGTIMYDVLSLQDDYYHFGQFIRKANDSVIVGNLEENISKIEELLGTLEGEIDKYGGNCMNCNNNLRHKRGILDVMDRPVNYDYNDYTLGKPDISTIDTLINMKIVEIQQAITNDLGRIFDSFEEYIDANEYIDEYINTLLPTRDISYKIEEERSAFEALKNVVSNSSVQKFMDLMQKSEEILTSLQNAKEYLDSVTIL